MNKKLLSILWIGFFILLLNLNYASAIKNDDIKCDQEFSNIEPSFSIIVRNEKPTINKGDSIEYKININGYGARPNFSKLSVYLPIRFVNRTPNFGQIWFISENNEQLPPENITNYEYFTRPIPSYYFSYNSYGVLCQIKAEKLMDGYQPITIKINTSEKVTEGDHKLDFILSYSYGNKSYQDRQEATIHINSWQEEYYILNNIIIGLAIAGLLAISSRIKKICFTVWQKRP